MGTIENFSVHYTGTCSEKKQREEKGEAMVTSIFFSFMASDQPTVPKDHLDFARRY